MTTPRWYMLNKDGMATLCKNKKDAGKEARDMDMAWPHMGPHRAVQLVEVDSIEASAGSEPVAAAAQSALETLERTHQSLARQIDLIAERAPGNFLDKRPVVNTLTMHQKRTEAAAVALRAALDTHPSPPEGMVGGWMPIETAPKDGTRILLHPAVEVHDAWSKGHWSEQQKCWIVGGSASGVTHTHWMPLPLPPTTSAGSGKGE